MFRNILVPLDGSRFAEAALPLASHLIRTAEGRLHLVLSHVPIPVAIGVTEMVAPPVDLDDELKEQSRSYLHRTAARLHLGDAEPPAISLLDGAPGPAICQEATRLDADLVVMATHGRGAIGRFWLGSVADYVIRHLSIPVLLVHSGSGKTPASTAALGKILVALDLSAHAEAALEPAVKLARSTGASLVLMHVVPVQFEIGPPGLPGAFAPTPDALQASCIAAGHRLEEIAARIRKQGIRASIRLVADSAPARALLDALEEEEFDLIAMTTHGRSGVQRLLLGGVADKVIRGSAKPVLVLRPPPMVI